MSHLLRHMVVRLFLAVGGFFVLSWPMISSWRPESNGGIPRHLYFFWAVAIALLFFMSQGKDGEEGEGVEESRGGESGGD